MLLAASLAVASIVTLDVARTSRALAAGTGLEPLPGKQGLVPPGATLLGPAPSATTVPLEVTLQPRDPSALAAEVQAVSDPTSPAYRQYLTPAQFARSFGPSPATIARVSSALRNEGLTVGSPSSIGLSLPVSGTVAEIQSAFATPIARYRLSSGKTGIDTTSVPQVPVSVAPEIQGILGLDTLSPPQPSTSVPQASPAAPHGNALAAAPALAPGQPSPQPGTCTTAINSAASSTGALNAVQLSQAYSFGPLYSSNHYGAGTTVALLEMAGAGYLSSDISRFANCYGITLGAGQVTETTIDGGGATGGATVEAELDIETVLSLAPKASVEVYEGGPADSMYTVFSRIVSDDTAKIVSASWTNGCEAYVGQSFQNSENTLFQAAATEGQSIFVATGDQGAQGCNVNGEISAGTGSAPVAQAVDPSTSTLYIANQSSNTVSVDSEGSTSNPTNFATAGSVSTGSGPDAVALDSTAGKVFVANAGGTLTVFSTNSCNQSTTSGCGSPMQIASVGHLNAPTALAVSGSTLYVANGNGTVAVYNAATNAYVTSVNLPALSTPTALAVDSTNGVVYLTDGGNSRIEYFNASTCNASTTTGCSTTPTTVPVGQHPVALAVASTAGDLYVANAGSGGGISVVSLSTHAVVTTISTSQPSNGTGVVQSIGMSPDNHGVLAVLNNLGFPGDVMATINTSTQSIASTVNLETGTDTMGQLVSDGTLGYVWVTDETNNSDVIQNLNLAVSDPASQPYVTAVGGTSLALGPPPTEKVWNDQLNYSEGAGGGGISKTFTMPVYQQSLGTVSGSSGTPCAASSGNCRETPDVSADADPSTGYIIYDSVNGLGWWALGGTSAATPLWAGVLAVAASANGNTAGYGALNPALYLLAQKAPGTFLNDVTSGNNDYNATNNGQYPAMAGYDMSTGLGTPVASALATGLTGIPLAVAVSGTQTYGGSPTFTASANYAGSGSAPFGVSLNTGGFTCTTVDTSSTISPTLTVGGHTLVASSCSGLTLSGTNAADYSIVYTSTSNDFTVTPAPVNVAVSGTQTYGGTPNFVGTDSPPSGVTVSTSGLSCRKVGTSTTIGPSLPAGSDTLVASSCSGASLSGASASDYTVAYSSAPGDFAVAPAPLNITASNGSMSYGGSVPTITPAYSGFVNGDTSSSLTTKPNCSTTATSSSPVLGSPYVSSCGGAVDPNYTISYFGGSVTVSATTLTITASSPTMTYGSTPPAITPVYTGFKNGDTASSLTAQPTCSTTVTSSSPVAGSPYPSACSGAADSNYAIGYVGGSVTLSKAPLTITATNGSMTYGGSVPTITPAYAGFVNGDTSSSLTSQPTCSTTATSASPVSGSPYVSLCSGAADPNYAVSYVAGSVTVSPAPLTITASNGSMGYGGSVPTITPAYSGFVNGDTSSSLTTKPTCSTTAIGSSSVVGSPYTSSCSGAADPNYAIGYVAGSVTVSPAPLTITASSPGMTYGGSVPTITAGYSGFKNGDSASLLTTKPTCSTTATSSSTVLGSPYVSSCGGAVDPNYAIRYVGGGVTVAAARLTITAASGSTTYGGSVPTITPGYSGFENGESASSLTAQPTCSTTATSSSPAAGSPYVSLCSGAAGPNYAISYIAGSVTVNPAPLTITATNGFMTYGGSVPTITAAYAGFVNGDSSTSLTTKPTCSTTATRSSPVSGSPYVSSCSGAVDPNYAISYLAGSVTVSRATLTITAQSPATTYGSVPTITAAYTGFVNGDSSTSLTTKPTCSTTATSSSPVSGSPYASSCSGAVDPNYVISDVAGSVAVNPASLTITASSGSMTYGGSVPTITPGYSGFENGESASSLTAQPTCSTTAASSSPPSPPTYVSSCSGASDPNYAIAYVAGATTVTPVPIAVAVSGAQANGGSPSFSGTDNPPPGMTVALGGLTCSQVAPSTPITATLAAGGYTLVSGSCSGASLSGTAAADYAVTYTSAPGDFTVTGGPPAPPPPPPAPGHGYWLVGSDGGIFTFGSAAFYGSTGSLSLQRPVVGITPTRDRGGYWLVASDGGTFAFGDAGFYGSIPGLGLHPAGSGLPHSLNAPIVAMVPAADGQGYFVVASDGGVFAFGPGASFAGSCPGIGGCSGPAVAVIPDSTGNGYWLFTATGNVYTFGDAAYLGSPGGVGSPVTSAVRTPDGKGYWVLVANGSVYGYGDAPNYGSPGGQLGGVDPATAIFTTSDGAGYWVVSAVGAVDPYGDAPNQGGMAGTRLNGSIIAATGF